MLGDLFPLAAALAAAVAIFILRDRHRKRTEVRPPRPDITLEEVSEGESEELRAALAALAPHLASAGHPRLALRSAILEAAAMALHLQTIAELGETEREALLKGYQAGMDGRLRYACDLYHAQWRALRRYGWLKYDDAVAGDWFDHFLQVAGPYIREKVRLAREYLVEVDESAARFARIYDELLDELRREMLKVPPKRHFPPVDLPATSTRA